MYELRLFGGATLEGPEGPVSGRAAQRRQLALLAFLALQGDRPTPRDKLLALLWPDSDTERARHNLADGVYLVRRELGENSLASLGDDLLLSRGHVRCDVAEFETRLEEGDLEGAAGLYEGPFLDGFHVPDSHEFEHWLTEQRERLARAYLRALEELAARADRAGDYGMAVEWWRKAASEQPHNARVATGLMAALAAAGDRAGALRWARIHGQLLQEEFGIEPDPAVAELAAELRDGNGVATEGPASAVMTPPSSLPAPSPLPRNRIPEDRPAPRRPGVLAGFALGLGILFLAAALYLGTNGDVPGAAGLAHDLDADAVVVLPFRTAGASPDVEYLGQGMMELLAARLSGDGGLRAVDPGIVLAGWGTGSGWEAGETQAAGSVELARGLGAANLITGGVVGTTATLTVHATILDTRTGEVTAEGTVHGTEDALPALVDRLVAQLLVRRAGEEEHRLAHLTTTSSAALSAFLHGRAAHRQGRYEEALRHYARAVELDPTFALAGRAITQVVGWVGGAIPLGDRAAQVVRENLDRLSERDRVGFQGRVKPRDPDRIPSAIERLEAVEEALRRWPDHPVLWYRRGDVLMHFGRSLGLPAWEARARESFERAMALDPDYAEPVHHLAVVLGEAGDTAALRSLVEEQLVRTPVGPVADHLRWRAHHNLGDASPVRPPPLEAMDTDATLRWIGIEGQDYGFAVAEGARAVEIRLARPGIRDEHFERRRGAFAYALNQGRPSEALAVLESIREVQPDPWSYHRIAVLTALYADGDEATASRSAAALADAPTDGALGELNLCVRAQWRLAREVPDGTPVDAVELPPEIAPTATDRLSSYRVICSAVVQAQHAALSTGRADGPSTVLLDSLLAMGRHWALVDDGHIEFAHLALARLHEEAGQPDAALRAVRRRVAYHGWQPYLAAMLRKEGRLAAELGDTAGALRAWEHYLAFRDDPEPSLRAEAESIRREVERLR